MHHEESTDHVDGRYEHAEDESEHDCSVESPVKSPNAEHRERCIANQLLEIKRDWIHILAVPKRRSTVMTSSVIRRDLQL